MINGPKLPNRLMRAGQTNRPIRLLIGLCLFATTCTLVVSARGAEDEPQSRLTAIQAELAAAEQEVAALKANQDAAEKAQADLSGKLVVVARNVQAIEQSSQKIDRLLNELNQSIADKEDALNEQDSDKQATIAALTRLTRRPDAIDLDDSTPLINKVRAAAVMQRIVPSIELQAAEIATELTALSREKTVQEQAQQKLDDSQAALHDRRQKLARLMDEKKDKQAALSKSLETTTTKIARLQSEARDLEDLLHKIEQAKNQRATQQAASQGTKPSGPRPNLRGLRTTSQSDAPRPNLLSLRAPTTMRATQSVRASAQADPEVQKALSYSGDFVAQKGKLRLPARGRLQVGFGARPYRGAAPQQGIKMAVANGAQVTASASGKVVYAGPFRSLGGLVILNVGQGYHLLMAGLTHIDVVLGQTLLAGEPVGIVMPQSRHTDGQNADDQGAAPSLYVEIRRDGKPVNPAYWFTRDERRFAGLL